MRNTIADHDDHKEQTKQQKSEFEVEELGVATKSTKGVYFGFGTDGGESPFDKIPI